MNKNTPHLMPKKLRVIDLFCGAGGFTLGFVRTGFEPVFALDFDRWAVETYLANFGRHAVCIAIEKVERFPSAEVVVGGPPCQGFSQLGKHLSNDPRNMLWQHYARAIRQIKPRAYVMENVPQLLKSTEFLRIRRPQQQAVGDTQTSHRRSPT
jgi:DNA (cytosine-5)-methyltransferase 1